MVESQAEPMARRYLSMVIGARADISVSDVIEKMRHLLDKEMTKTEMLAAIQLTTMLIMQEGAAKGVSSSEGCKLLLNQVYRDLMNARTQMKAGDEEANVCVSCES